MYNNVLVPVTVHFNILIFTVFKLFLITLHPPIHLLRRERLFYPISFNVLLIRLPISQFYIVIRIAFAI